MPDARHGVCNLARARMRPRSAQQHKDFQQRGDGAGPKGANTMPKRGG